MANHKSAEKAHKTSVIKAERNRSIKSRIKTFITKVEDSVAKKNPLTDIIQNFRIAESEIMKGVTKGVLKLNTASRRVSKLSRLVKKLESTSQV